MKAADLIIIDLEGLSLSRSIEAIERLESIPFAFRICTLWDWVGPRIIESLKEVGAKRIWADFSLYGSPETVAMRAYMIKMAGADFVSVAVSGGLEMLLAAKENGPEIVANIMPQSLGPKDILNIYGRSECPATIGLSRLAEEAEIGIVSCSPTQAGLIFDDFRGDLQFFLYDAHPDLIEAGKVKIIKEAR